MHLAFPRRPTPFAAAVLAVAATLSSRARAQDAVAGSARVALEASSARLDGGEFRTYTVSAAALPFLGAHAQVGVAPTYTVQKVRLSPRAYQFYGAGLTANYVFGGGARWRGYAGGYAAASGVVHGPGGRLAGAQVGALYFVDPALAARAELRYRVPTDGFYRGRGAEVLQVTLDPYLFGRADARGPAWTGLGTVDVAGSVSYEAAAGLREIAASAMVAPYLNRWTQVGVEGEAYQEFEQQFAAFQARRVRGFGRLYFPLTVRTQPFAEAFAEASTYSVRYPGLTGYGGALGVRRLLNARVALDVGVRRTLVPTLALGDPKVPFHFPGQTGLVAGLATRVGRVR